jgi:8-oxo-dGTP diphosphatase
MVPNVATLPITVGVGGFLAREGRLLVVRKSYGPSKGQWTIPSGYVERGETVVEAIEREVKEETGVVARAGSILAVRNRVTDQANDTFLIFRMAHISGEATPDRTEVSDAAFVPFAELAASPEAAPFTRAIVPKLIDSPGLRADSYAPPPPPQGRLTYRLYL